jgi:hypothetical protein
MQTNSNPAVTEQASQQRMPLHKLVDELLTSLLPRASALKSSIVNDINQELQVNTDQNLLASVLGSLLYNTVSHSWSNRIRVSANVYDLVTHVRVRNNIRENEKQLLDNLCQIQPLAEKLGGSISITDNMLNGTTIGFSFPNPGVAA